MTVATARISAAAIQKNLDYIRALAPGKSVMAVVKANGYGHGLATAVASLTGADSFAVARMNEAECLRTLTDKDVVVLEGFTDAAELEQAIELSLQSVIHSAYQLDLIKSAGKKVSVWLKVDTGMNRLGLSESEYQQILAASDSLDVKGVMSHMACADDADNAMNLRQIEAFDGLKREAVPASLANSAAVMGWPGAHFDVLRPGLMLYGINPFSEGTRHHDLTAAMEFVAPVISVKSVAAGETVGYGASWICPEDSKIAVVACGYGDGYRREAPDGTPVLINGERFPLVGRVSMDMICVDVTHGPEVNAGDVATLWGGDLPIEEVADCMGTIAYTLATGLTSRVVYQLAD